MRIFSCKGRAALPALFFTPMLALLASVVWVSLLRPRRQALFCGAALLVLVCVLFALSPEAMLQRGLSYRTEIWADVWQQSKAALIWGHGLDAELRVQLSDIPYPFSDPHNMTLSVLYRLGLVGVAFWGAMYVASLYAAWKHKRDDAVVIFSVAVVYGLIVCLAVYREISMKTICSISVMPRCEPGSMHITGLRLDPDIERG